MKKVAITLDDEIHEKARIERVGLGMNWDEYIKFLILIDKKFPSKKDVEVENKPKKKKK